jgi:serine/threonine protein kinase
MASSTDSDSTQLAVLRELARAPELRPAVAAGSPSEVSSAARFEREARALAQLSHPNVVAIHDVGSAQGQSYLALELLNGETLRAAFAAALFRSTR